MQVFIVDDDEFALHAMEGTLTHMGYTVVTARDGKSALQALRTGDVRLVITDWDMPGMNGIELCRAIRREDMSGYVYIIMLTGRDGARHRLEGLCAGADDFLTKPPDPEELLVSLKTAERILSLETRDLALFALAKLVESRDPETGSHIERVQNYARLIAQHLSDEVKSHYGVDDEFLRLLYQASPLHDLGKVAIPDAVLLKPAKLTVEEFTIMKTHTIIGAETLDAALRRFPNVRFLQVARDIAASHHEKFDGSGYPEGLAAEQIPLCARIVAAADVYDALTSRRIYKAAITHEDAKAIILRESGRHFDPEVVEAFIRAERGVIEIKERLNDDSEPAQAKPTIAQLPAPGEIGPNPCKILVVEDDVNLREKLVQVLSATGEPVVAACDGAEAMRLVAQHAPRVIVSDWVMPQMDGVEFCRALRAEPRPEAPHFIMLTAHSEKSRLLEAYQAGVDDFVSKPFDFEELLARVRVGIRGAKLRDDLVRRADGSHALNAQLATLNSRLEKLSITDELTGLFNRRHAMFRVEDQWAWCARHGKPLCVAMIDIDHFKLINDSHGHDAGDAVLRRVASLLRDQTRGTDAVCRIGGEEFLIIFPSQTVQEIGVCADRCRAAVDGHEFLVHGTCIRATISIGLAARLPYMTGFTDLLQAADQALYAAKRAGRNVVRIAQTIEQAMSPRSTPGDSTPAERQALDVPAIIKRCGNDPKFAAQLLGQFQTHASGELAKLENALAAGDAASATRSAHSLKSMTAYVTAETASGLARRIEELGRASQLSEIASLVSSLRQEIDWTISWIGNSEQVQTLKRAGGLGAD
jgi:putative two-component system response regulator